MNVEAIPVEEIIEEKQTIGRATNGMEITIDREKCIYSMYDPKGCKKCLQICSPKVFATRPEQKRDFSGPKETRTDPTKWILVIPWPDLCNLCAACLKECPKDAITIRVNGKELSVSK